MNNRNVHARDDHTNTTGENRQLKNAVGIMSKRIRKKEFMVPVITASQYAPKALNLYSKA